MYRILIENGKYTHEYEELIKIFLRPEDYAIVDGGGHELFFRQYGDKNITKKEIYETLSRLTGLRPPWGILTGIRPVKLTGEILSATGSEEETLEKLKEYYCISEEKAELALSVYRRQLETAGRPAPDSVGLYIGIPFCPTRCLYCSFASNQTDEGEIDRYMRALERELDAAAGIMKRRGLFAESIYVGGGTPTALGPDNLSRLMSRIRNNFCSSGTKELSVEAGRPDTVTEEKLKILAEAGVDRISINPQTMKDETLKLIGREHTSEDIVRAFEMARKIGIGTVNADIIAGLPEEDLHDFNSTLAAVIDLHPENITVHSLAVKRASRLAERDAEYHYRQWGLVTEMLDSARQRLDGENYRPYYLYRQKHMSGAQENTGYALKGSENIYNIRIMDEHQTIIAMGAGGISKVYYPEENRLERVPNVTNYEIYIDRIDEMIERKLKAL